MSFTVRVEGFSEGADIPRRYTCEGQNTPPVIEWTAEPATTQSFAVIVDDPDAPAGTWTHWLVWDIPDNVRSLSAQAEKVNGIKSGTNDFGVGTAVLVHQKAEGRIATFSAYSR